MISIQHSAGALRRLLILASTLTLGSALAFAGDVYLSPSGTGTQSGVDATNTKPASYLQTAINGLAAGETIYLVNTGTAYTFNDANPSDRFVITGSGTASSPKRIIGLADGSGNYPLLQGSFDAGNAATPGANSSVNYLFKFDSTAPVSYWEIKNLRFEKHGFVFAMGLTTGQTFGLRSHLTFENLAMDTIEDGIRIYNAEYIVVKNCSVIRHTKKAFRMGDYSRFLVFDGCTTDATGGSSTFPTRSIPVGYGGDATDGKPIIYDLRFTNCVARHNGFAQPDSDYWNGDGFSTERGTYNVTFVRCQSYDNNDGGFDNKAENVLFDNCISLRNKKSWRIWGSSWLINCVGAYSKKGENLFSGGGTLGGTSGADGVQIDPAGSAIIDGGTFHNAVSTQFHVEDDGHFLEASNAILSVDGTFSNGTMTTGAAGTIILVDSVQYTPGGPVTAPSYDPLLSASWEDTPTTATYFNTTNYSPAKGYWGQGAASTLPAAPSNLNATLDPTSPRRITLTWSDQSDNERDFLIERSTDNVTFTQVGIAGTNNTVFTDFGLSPATTYYYRVRATNSVGDSSASNTDSVSIPALTAPIAPIGLTVETSLGSRTVAPGGTILLWTDRSNNEDSFLIERSTDNLSFTQIGTQDENFPTYTDITASQGTIYYYRVRASNTAGDSAYSNSAKTTSPTIYVKDDNDPTGIAVVGAWTLVTPSGSSSSLRYGATYLHDADAPGGKSVTFTPTIGAAGDYEVYSWWPGASNRATNVPVDITYSGGVSTVTVNQRPDDGIWHPIGTYNFNTGTTGNVKVRNDSTNGFVMADAVLFMTARVVPAAPTSLTATAASDSQINLAWTDNASTENSYAIEYSTDNVTFARLGSVNANTTTFAATNLVAGVTYYFRVHANGGGGYSDYSNTASTFTQFTLIKDNADLSGITQTGSWIVANAVSGSYNGNYLHDNDARSGKSVRFTPVIPETGSYQVWARWTAHATNRATNAAYDVINAAGTTTVYENQRTNNNTWISLGTYTFNAGSDGGVLLRDDGCDGYVIADAVKFVRVP